MTKFEDDPYVNDGKYLMFFTVSKIMNVFVLVLSIVFKRNLTSCQYKTFILEGTKVKWESSRRDGELGLNSKCNR